MSDDRTRAQHEALATRQADERSSTNAGEVSFRLAAPADASTLAEFAERTFRDTYAGDNGADDVEAYVALAFGQTRQAEELADPYVACVLGELHGSAPNDAPLLVAYGLLRVDVPDETPPQVTGARPVELARFYVERAHHGSGLAARLMAAVTAAARARGGRTLWLGVWERNERARAFYAKHEFREVGAHAFRLGGELQRDLLLARAL